MVAPRKLPERDRLQTLLLSGRTVPQLAEMYHVSTAAVRRMLEREGLEGIVPMGRPSYRDFIPWTVKVKHNQDYAVRCLRLYFRSLGLGPPLHDQALAAKTEPLTPAEASRVSSLAKLRGLLAGFVAELNDQEVVVTYDPDQGFYYVPRKEGDRHYVRWPDNVRDTREGVLARTRAS